MRNLVIKRIILLVFVTSLLWCFAVTFKFPYIGAYLEVNEKKEWVIKKLEIDSASQKLDLRVGDIIRLVDNKEPEQFPSISKWKTLEQSHSLVVSRNGIEHAVEINAESEITYDVVPVAEGLLSLFLGILLYIKIRNSISARILSIVFTAIGAIWISLGASVRGDTIGKILITSFVTALPIIFLHFLITFFAEKGTIKLPTKPLKYLHFFAAAACSFRFLYFIPSFASSIYQYNGKITLFTFVVGFLLNISVITYVFYRYRSEKSHLSSIIKTVWFSFFFSFLPAICLTFLPILLTGKYIIHEDYTSLFILLFPATFAYLIASNQLYDIGLVLRRFLFAGLISIVPSAIFSAINAYVFHTDTDAKHVFFQFIVLLILFTFVLYGMEYFTGKLEPLLFPRKAALQKALKKISKDLRTISNFRELKDIVLVDIVETLQVAGGAIAFKSNDQLEIIHAGQIDEEEVERLLQSPFPYHHVSYSCIEINRHEEYTSYLIMTRKKTNTLLGKEELQWLALITSYLAVSMENVHLIRKMTLKLQQLASQLPDEQEARDIQWFRKVMFELQEEERTRIATDLHDTTMQDLFFLKRRFVSLLNKYALNKEDKEQLSNLINFVELINTNLRQSCFELHPFLLQEIGLIQTVRKLLEKETYLVPFKIEFAADEAAAVVEHKDITEKKHIFRIVQELLNNAKKHSQADKIEFRMTVEGGRFHLVYEDDGVGFDHQAGAAREIGGSGIGLEQLRGRILHLGGTLDISSSRGCGASFHIAIPMNAASSRFPANA